MKEENEISNQPHTVKSHDIRIDTAYAEWLYEHQGKILNNFAEHMPALQSKLVQEMLKENYDFGFRCRKNCQSTGCVRQR